MKNFIHTIKDSWVIIAFLCAMVLWYGTVNSRISALEAKAQEQNDALVQLMQIKTDIEVVKAKVDFIYNKVK